MAFGQSDYVLKVIQTVSWTVIPVTELPCWCTHWVPAAGSGVERI